MKLNHIEKVINPVTLEPVYNIVFKSKDLGEVDCLRAHLGESHIEYRARVDMTQSLDNKIKQAANKEVLEKVSKSATEAAKAAKSMTDLAKVMDQWPKENPSLVCTGRSNGKTLKAMESLLMHDMPVLDPQKVVVAKFAKPKDQIIINPPAVILIKDGKKYVSKAHEEEFDEEKGLLMCLAKAQGITHLELKRMLKNAKRPEKKEKKVKEAKDDK